MGLWRFLRRTSAESELEREIQLHIDLETEANVRAGMPADAARRAALIAFGGVLVTKEAVRDERRGQWLEQAAADVRFALRGFRRSPGFTVAAAITLIGAITALATLFSYSNAAYFAKLPYKDADRLVALSAGGSHGLTTFAGVPLGAIQTIRRTSHSFDRLAAFDEGGGTALFAGVPRRVGTLRADTAFASLFDLRPVTGRRRMWCA